MGPWTTNDLPTMFERQIIYRHSPTMLVAGEENAAHPTQTQGSTELNTPQHNTRPEGAIPLQ